nr:hypothetical protein [Bacteroidia bacterium]
MLKYKSSPLFRSGILSVLVYLGSTLSAFGTLKTPALSGNWSNPLTWGGASSPGSSDNITIPSGVVIVLDTDITVKELIVSANATINWVPGKRLTIQNNFTVHGTVNMNGGLITLSSPGLQFTLGAGSVFTWDPGTNTSAEATLFTRGVENFAPTSTLIIKKWYNYAIALGTVVTGNFGNLILNSLSGTNAIVEWDQNNQFQSHQIAGTLTIDQGWITLDKSGSISNTTISKLVLTSVNSYLYGHSGNHPGSFQINFGSITNNGGIVYALNDGTGNVVLNVYGDVYNIGNIKIIMNSGVAGAGNGNANFTVNGNFAQSTGDTRIIYNVASSASGVYNCTFGSMTLTGGIFMGQTGCHTGGATCSLTVTNDAIINFTGNADKFRGTSLSSIGANVNNTGFILNVGGNLDFSGPASSEFTTSASYGTESINISGNLIVRGGIFSINYGTSAAAHSSILNVGGAFNISGGSTFLSRNAGSSEQSVAGNLSISAGMLISKGSTGLTNLTITGNYTQSGGMVYLHGNSSLLTTDKISMTIHGNFNQSGGVLSFDDNSSAGSTSHEITLMGSEYSISGTGVITQAGAGTSSVFGKIRFAKNGAIQMQRGEGHQILQAKQEVSAKCTLSVNSGNIQVSSHGTASTTYFRIRSQGQVQLKSGQIYSDGNYQNSGIQVDSAAILSIY